MLPTTHFTDKETKAQRAGNGTRPTQSLSGEARICTTSVGFWNLHFETTLLYRPRKSSRFGCCIEHALAQVKLPLSVAAPGSRPFRKPHPPLPCGTDIEVSKGASRSGAGGAFAEVLGEEPGVGLGRWGHGLAEAWDHPQGPTGMQRLRKQYLHYGRFAARCLIPLIAD